MSSAHATYCRVPPDHVPAVAAVLGGAPLATLPASVVDALTATAQHLYAEAVARGLAGGRDLAR